MYCLDNGTLLRHLMGFVILPHLSECHFKPHTHDMGPRGTKHHFWQPVLIKKCQEAHILCVLLSFSQKRYIMISQNLQEIVNFVSIYFESPETHNLNKDHNYLWISLNEYCRYITKLYLIVFKKINCRL